MTAIQSPAAPQPERRTDPSMEEILASIRRIIADEEGPSQPAAASEPRSREPVDLRTAAVVTPISSQDPATQVLAPQVSAPQVSAPQVSAPQVFAPRTYGQPPFGLSRPQPPARDIFPTLPLRGSEAISPSSAAAETAAPQPEPSAASVQPEVPHFETVGEEPGPSDGSALVSAAASDSIASAFQTLAASVALTNSDMIDRHVRDLLRPMLRTWLDDNLPVIVEKLVRTEIERVARGGR